MAYTVNEAGAVLVQVLGAAGAIVGGSGANQQVAYWTGANTLDGDPGFTYNPATDTITIGAIGVATGGDIDPADASGQDLGDSTHRWDLYTQDMIFGGASGANVVTLPDNLAIALKVVEDGLAVEYLRIDTRDAQPIVRFNNNGLDVNFYVEAVGVADALYIRGADGQVTLGVLTAGYVKSSAGGVLSVSTEVALVDLADYTQGDLIFGGAADWDDLAHPGAANRVLQSSAAEVVWSANAVTFPAAGAVPVGSGGANQVAYWTGANTLAGDAGLLVDAGNNMYIVADAGGIGNAVGTARLHFDSSGGTDYAYFSGCKVGIGIAGPDGTVHVHTASAGAVAADADSDDLVVENSGAGGISILTPDANPGLIRWGSPEDNLAAQIYWNHSTHLMAVGTAHPSAEVQFYSADDVAVMRLDANQNVGIGLIAGIAGKTHIKVVDAAAIPVLVLEQLDVDQDMIEFITTIGVGNAIEAVNGKTLTTTHFIKVAIPGPLSRYVAVGTIA